jgi:hypothetical protein
MKTLLTLLTLLIAAPVAAQTVIQTGPVPVGAKIAFKASDNIPTAAQALTFEARLKRNGTPMTAATATTGLTCTQAVAPATGVNCQWPLTLSNLDALNQIGSHTLTLTLFRADVGESPASSPFVLTSPAAAPSDLKIIP